MANQSQPFRQHHIKRALKAAEAAGMRNPMVEVHLPTGTKLIIGSQPAAKTVSKPVQRKGVR